MRQLDGILLRGFFGRVGTLLGETAQVGDLVVDRFAAFAEGLAELRLSVLRDGPDIAQFGAS